MLGRGGLRARPGQQPGGRGPGSRLVGRAAISDVGLLAEEVDPRDGEMIGNFPQAFSHIGLVNAAWAISQARK